jgi:general secretion pathway protein D
MMNNPLDQILDKTRMNQVMVSKKLRLSIRGYLQAAMLGAALSAVLPVQVYAADEDLVAPEPSVLGIAEGERVIEPVTALANPTPVPAKVLRNKPVAYKPALPKKATNTGEDAIISKLEFKQANMVDVVRALADMSGLNIVATDEAAKKTVTVFLQNISVKDALDTISKNSGLWYRQDKTSKTYRIMSTVEFQSDMVVYREDVTKIFNLMHPNPVIVATAIRDIYGDRVRLSLGVEDTTTIGGFAAGTTQTTTTSNFNRNGNSGNRTSSRTTTTRTGQPATTGVGGIGVESDRAVTDRLTPEQLDKLTDRLVEYGDVRTIASEALKGISRSEQPIYITLNREHNLLIVRTTDMEAVKDIEYLIKEMDRPTPQVLLEMKVLELTSGDSFRQSFSLSGTSGDGTGKHDQTFGLGNFPVEGGSLVYTYMSKVISARLELLEKNNHVNTLSSPILLASNNKMSKVFVGQERVIVTGIASTLSLVSNGVVTPGLVTPVTEVREIGNTLQILPKINADRSVTLIIQQDSSTVTVGGGTIPIVANNVVQNFNIDTVNISKIEGTVVAKDGLTVAIGGLIGSSTSNNVQKVPFLGDIPILGQLFQRKDNSTTKSELILLITPHIITAPSEAEDVTRDAVEIISEQEW